MLTTNTNDKINKARKKLFWLIDGLNKTGLKISDWNKVTWEWITKNYNVDNY